MLLLCHKMVSKGIESYKTSRNGHEKCIFETFTMRWNMLWISENHISMLKWDKIFTFPYGRPWPPLTVKSWITFSLSIQIHFQFRDSKKTTLYKKDTIATDDTDDGDDSDDSDNGACKWGPKVGRCSLRSAQVSCKLHAQIIEALWIPNHHQCLQNLPRKYVTISDITILEIAVYMNDYDSIVIIW